MLNLFDGPKYMEWNNQLLLLLYYCNNCHEYLYKLKFDLYLYFFIIYNFVNIYGKR